MDNYKDIITISHDGLEQNSVIAKNYSWRIGLEFQSKGQREAFNIIYNIESVATYSNITTNM